MQICIAVASGAKTFLNQLLEVQGDTLFIDYEMGDVLVKKRISNLYKKIPEDLSTQKGLYRPYVDSFVGMSFKEGKRKLELYLIEVKPVLCVVDNLKTFCSDIDFVHDQKDVINRITELRSLCLKHNCALVIIAHPRKNTSYLPSTSDLVSGSGSIPDLADNDLFIRKTNDPKKRLLRRDKSRAFEGSEKGDLITFSDGGWFQHDRIVDNEWEVLPKEKKISLLELSTTDRKRVAAQYLHFDLRYSVLEVARIMKAKKSTAQGWINYGKKREMKFDTEMD